MGNQFCMDDGSDNPGVDIVLDANQHLDLDYNHNTLYYHFMDTDMDNIHTLYDDAHNNPLLYSDGCSSPSEVIVVHHNKGGLSPGAVGGIVIGVFFGVLLLFLLCIFCFRARRRNAYYADDESSEDSRDRHRPRPVDPYGGRPMTFVGGGNQRETKVVITKSQRVFVRPPPAKRERIERIRRERMVVVDDD
ncbi:hypothetical protein LTR47_010164 [Exophiala xenobiotica]|nr:hypothetical protein LTR41_008487 [Exophiala xenobiotica]KAK5217013.1 hypothetical protein LTR72_010008 [Exophiala xenobiotica]KAK5223432.1 hypothetical protein LTR47_010164 [Exophiala xenobiotica]KAK5251357.1 hypothetical protein LTS06_003918 [Exophiala xenobiotica]KAK5287675.1 hypothetical protein LTR14_008905 [Exophiala xenobiotica]